MARPGGGRIARAAGLALTGLAASCGQRAPSPSAMDAGARLAEVAGLLDADPDRAVSAAERFLADGLLLEEARGLRGTDREGEIAADGMEALVAALLLRSARTGDASPLDRAEVLGRDALVRREMFMDRPGEVRAMWNLGLVDLGRGRYPEAAATLHRALRRVTALPAAREERVAILAALGLAWSGEGEYDQARMALEDARVRAAGWRLTAGEGRAVLGLVLLSRLEGEPPPEDLVAAAGRIAAGVPGADLRGGLERVARGEEVTLAENLGLLRPRLPASGPPR